MEEPRWYNGAEEYRAVQGLVRDGRYREAVERAQHTLLDGYLGRKHAARLHSQICWLYTDKLHQTCPAAILHGEEALRLATLVRDQWIRSEALVRLIHAYCQVCDLQRARAACTDLAEEIRQNDAAIAGGHAAFLQLEAMVAAAFGDEDGCLSTLGLAEDLSDIYPPAVGLRIRLQRLLTLLDFGRFREARLLLATVPQEVDGVEWALVHAWLAAAEHPGPEAGAMVRAVLTRALEEGNQAAVIHCVTLQALVTAHTDAGEAQSLARRAAERATAAGRIDLTRSLRRRLGHLL
ncbi:MAG TPA: hypothetical protein VD902_22020 [Symbiobacteriaceae bacterium]|nr:hypothetical protein [Symbiobacteriaceae bacterium]